MPQKTPPEGRLDSLKITRCTPVPAGPGQEDYLNYSDLRDFITGMAQPKLNRTMLDTVPIPLPEQEEQHRIADCLTALDSQIAAQAAKIESLKQHKRGLMQQLFPSPEAFEA